MSDYRVATGWNVALGSLARVVPQGRSPGIQVTRRNHLAYPAIIDEGPYIELAWNILRNDNGVMYRALLDQFGLKTAKAAQVTIYCRDDLFQYTRYNGVAIRPQQTWDNYFPRDILILVRDLVPST